MVIRASALGAAAAGLLASQASRAADLPAQAAPIPAFVVQDWSGFYVGSHLGGVVSGRGERRVVSGDGGGLIPAGFGGRGGRTGIAIGRIEGRTVFQGVHAGYNWQQGSAVAGIEADLASLGPVDDLLGSVRGRLGFGSDRLLIYGTGGLAIRSVPGLVLGTFVGGNGGAGGNGGPGGAGGNGGNGFGTLTIARGGSDDVGFVGGGGVEVKLTPLVGAGLEALYYRFDGPRLLGAPRDFLTLRGRLTLHPGAALAPASSLASFPVSWAGAYVGGHLGALHTLSGRTFGSTALAGGEPGGAGQRGIDGGGGGGGAVAFAGLARSPAILGGAHLGYNWQNAALVYGAEGDVSVSAADSHRYLGTIRGRLGWSGGATLVYATAGVAFAGNESVRAVFAGNGGAGGNGGAVLAAPGGAGGAGGQALAFRANDTEIGFVVGGGLEARLSERVSAGAEALYYGLSSRAFAPALPGPGRTLVAGRGNDALVLRTRLSFSFEP
ncbi:outer membrane protein [Methylobacterium nodulans]|uniref:PE-PGRS family protein n=1 Tax=Methylobacterium nodulans (strain LMG 21967 / CNCM I-2342 / ORS 2060) TaxID=460265 RepID=B8IBS8_METNO|nr:hypothetical protein [Methylobacterium nodulans]ACL59332.1 PE-PGRS family protein [Methylobacterium nodulans ORS 2060]